MSLHVSEGISKQYCLPFSWINIWKLNTCPLNSQPIIYGTKWRATPCKDFPSIIRLRNKIPESLESITKGPWSIWYQTPLWKVIINDVYFCPLRKLDVKFWLYKSLYQATNSSLSDCALRSTIRLDPNLIVDAIKTPITKRTIAISMSVKDFFMVNREIKYVLNVRIRAEVATSLHEKKQQKRFVFKKFLSIMNLYLWLP